jgi:tetraacyldisaccharide 4'-kinase
MSLDTRFQQLWYDRPRAAWWLLPFSVLFALLISVRRWMFRAGVLRSIRVSCPVIVVGNLTVGGTGKTPLVIWLANALTAHGYRVGVITRGYGGKSRHWPQRVEASSMPAIVGDESVLIAQQTQALVFAGPDRVAAAQQAIAAGAQLVISDDGLQHYRLQRDLEWVVVDASRLFGNAHLLPAGPLREPVRRLSEVSRVLVNERLGGRHGAPPAALNRPHITYRVGLTQLRSLKTGEQRELATLRGQQVHVVTGIGNPQAFLQALHEQGVRFDARILPDHASFTVDDIEFGDALLVLITEKDAVKCAAFATSRHWAVGAEVLLEAADQAQLVTEVQQCLAAHAS